MDDFEEFCLDMDAECLHQDFDDVDLYGEKMWEPPYDDFGEELELD